MSLILALLITVFCMVPALGDAAMAETATGRTLAVWDSGIQVILPSDFVLTDRKSEYHLYESTTTGMGISLDKIGFYLAIDDWKDALENDG